MDAESYPAALTFEIICARCEGSTITEMIDAGQTIVRCYNCGNQSTLEEARIDVLRFLEDHRSGCLAPIPARLKNSTDLFELTAEQIHMVPYRFILKEEKSG